MAADRARSSSHYRDAKRRFAGQPCIYCGRPSDTVEHVVPVSLGGTDDPSNLAPACARCNYSRGATLGNRRRAARRRAPRRHVPPPSRLPPRTVTDGDPPLEMSPRGGFGLSPRWRRNDPGEGGTDPEGPDQ